MKPSEINKTTAEAMIFHQAEEPFTRAKVELPTPKPDEVLVKIEYTTICSSDLHTYCGRRKSPSPSILGHEIIGRIIVLGNHMAKDYNGKDLKPGNLVTWSVYAHDEEGPMAKKGFPQKSSGLFKYGHQQATPDKPLSGGFATHCLLRKGTAVFNLSAGLTYRELAPLNCTHATMAGAIRLAGNLTGRNVLVTGAGMLGLSACAMANESGAKNVFVSDLNVERIRLAKKFGVKKALRSMDGQALVDQLPANEKIDVVIDTTGVPSVMEEGLSLLNIGGIAVWVGAVYSQRNTQVNAEMVVRNLLTIKGLHNYRPDDLAKAIAFIERYHGKYPFDTLVQKDFPLGDLDLAFTEATNAAHYRVGIRQEK